MSSKLLVNHFRAKRQTKRKERTIAFAKRSGCILFAVLLFLCALCANCDKPITFYLCSLMLIAPGVLCYRRIHKPLPLPIVPICVILIIPALLLMGWQIYIAPVTNLDLYDRCRMEFVSNVGVKIGDVFPETQITSMIYQRHSAIGRHTFQVSALPSIEEINRIKARFAAECHAAEDGFEQITLAQGRCNIVISPSIITYTYME